jgi:16S rRNA (uracil1498-N3)-methyltransferase
MPSAASSPRIHSPEPLASGRTLALAPVAARHVQVLRLQPGGALTLFDGRGGEYEAVVERMGRSEVVVRIGAHRGLEREAAREVHLAVGMPANERMDWLVEKAAELGVASVQPLVSQHSVLRPEGERAQKKQQHWQSVAIAACEQCGRNRVPTVHPVLTLAAWLRQAPPGTARLMLSLDPQAQPASAMLAHPAPLLALSGPEGGLSAAEEQLAHDAGFQPVSLGPRILRADTAPLALLALAVLMS